MTEDGFKIFPVDIWKLIMYDYLDFKTKQSLSHANKRLRGFFRDYQIKEMKKYAFQEKRIYDVDFKKLFHCLTTYNNKNTNVFSNKNNVLKYNFIYLLYMYDNKILNIEQSLNPYVEEESFKDIELIQGQVNCKSGEALNAYLKCNGDIINSIMMLN